MYSLSVVLKCHSLSLWITSWGGASTTNYVALCAARRHWILSVWPGCPLRILFARSFSFDRWKHCPGWQSHLGCPNKLRLRVWSIERLECNVMTVSGSSMLGLIENNDAPKRNATTDNQRQQRNVLWVPLLARLRRRRRRRFIQSTGRQYSVRQWLPRARAIIKYV